MTFEATTRRRIATVAVLAALTGLGGVALETNTGAPPSPVAATSVASTAQTGGTKPIVTSSSGAVATSQVTPTAAQPAASHTSQQPIKTQTSGGGGQRPRGDEELD